MNQVIEGVRLIGKMVACHAIAAGSSPVLPANISLAKDKYGT